MPAHSTTCLALRKTAHVSLCAIALLVAACAAPRHGEVPPDSPEIGKAAAALRKLNPAAVQAYALRVRLASTVSSGDRVGTSSSCQPASVL